MMVYCLVSAVVAMEEEGAPWTQGGTSEMNQIQRKRGGHMPLSVYSTVLERNK